MIIEYNIVTYFLGVVISFCLFLAIQRHYYNYHDLSDYFDFKMKTLVVVVGFLSWHGLITCLLVLIINKVRHPKMYKREK